MKGLGAARCVYNVVAVGWTLMRQARDTSLGVAAIAFALELAWTLFSNFSGLTLEAGPNVALAFVLVVLVFFFLWNSTTLTGPLRIVAMIVSPIAIAGLCLWAINIRSRHEADQARKEAERDQRESQMAAKVDAEHEEAQREREEARRDREAAEKARQEQQAATEATRVVCTQCAAEKMGQVRRAQRGGIMTGSKLLELIGAGECAKYFDVGWKLFLTDGTKMENESEAAMGKYLDITLDWSSVKVSAVTERGVLFTAPGLKVRYPSVKGTVPDFRVGIERGQGCPPKTKAFSLPGLTVAGAVIDGNDHQLLAIMGAHKEAQ